MFPPRLCLFQGNIWQGADVKVILLWLGCLLQREHYTYNQKIILLFPTAPVILSSNKQTNSLGRRGDTQHKQYWLLKKHPSAALQTWLRTQDKSVDKTFFFSPTHSHPPTQVQNTRREHTQRAGHTIRAASAGSLVSLLFCAVSWRCGCAKPVTQTLSGPLQTPTHHLGRCAPVPPRNERQWK